jgi:hypothetical protein
VADALGVDDKGQTYCDDDSGKKLVYTIGGTNFILKHHDYVDTIDERFGRCMFNDQKNNKAKVFSLPVTFFRKRCLLFDFEKRQIGFSDKR